MIRFLKASLYYQDYLTKFYHKNTLLKESSYNEIQKALFADAYGWSDFWKIHLEKTGNYEVQEIVINDEIQQKKWAKEHGFKFREGSHSWMFDIFAAQVAEIKPDIYFNHNFALNSGYRERLRKENPSIKIIISWDGVKLHDVEKFAGCDIMLSCVEETSNFYSHNGFKGYVFKLGFESSILGRINKKVELYPLSFVGSLILWDKYHLDRFKILSEISKKYPLDVWLSSFVPETKKIFYKSQFHRLLKGKFYELINVPRLINLNKGELYGMDMFQTLIDSKITLNTHIDVASKAAGNMRLYEATGVGTCLVTDWKENLNELFEIDKEIIAYKSVDECIDKVKYLLEHDEERKKIAEAGQKRALKDYSIGKQITDFSEFLMQMF